jgi:anti-sigma regulatory factor (Ser/Thr protein kinase)
MLSKLFNSRQSDLILIRNFIKDFLIEKNVEDNLQYQIILAVGEAAMNIVQHAYQGGNSSKEIKVNIGLINKVIKIDLFDEGEKADQSRIKPRKLEDIRPGGLGVHFIKMVMDEVNWIEAKEKWVNHLELKKKLK